MEISVIIPTFNGAHKIGGALTSLRNQTLRNFEVVVVVDGSTDQTAGIVQRFMDEIPNLVIQVLQNGGRARARNAGASAAKGRILVFMDDDVRLFNDAIALHQQFHTENQNQILFGHLEMDPAMTNGNDFWNFRRAIESSWREGRDSRISYENYAFTSANLSLTGETFQRVGGFDPDLRDSEDFDFSIRALGLEIPIRYSPKVRGYHDDYSTLAQYVQRQREYTKSKYVLLKKHPVYMEYLPDQFKWIMPLQGDRLKKWIFSNPTLWEDLFATAMFSLVPRAMRHRLYRTFIYVQSVVVNRISIKSR